MLQQTCYVVFVTKLEKINVIGLVYFTGQQSIARIETIEFKSIRFSDAWCTLVEAFDTLHTWRLLLRL